MHDYDPSEDYEPDPDDFPEDEAEIDATEALRQFFTENKDGVFYSRQLYVLHEDRFFHWVTGRAVKNLVDEGLVRTESSRPMHHGGEIHLYWHKNFRYYKRSATGLLSLVHEYANPEFGKLLGHTGENLIALGFARGQFVLVAENARNYRGREYKASGHDLDFIFERDGLAYGVEVKNTLTYPDKKELNIKIGLCEQLGITPVVAARMLPKNWINDLRERGGFALILKWQLYPLSHKDLADHVKEELGIKADAPKALYEGTMKRFFDWHEKRLKKV